MDEHARKEKKKPWIFLNSGTETEVTCQEEKT
jgi:hypothetical protein